MARYRPWMLWKWMAIIANWPKTCWANVFIAENEDALANSNGAVVLEKHGKYVKGKYSLTGGSVGLFEGKKDRPG